MQDEQQKSPMAEGGIVRVLRAARELISDPARWTQRAHARDATGGLVGIHDARACRWCMVGAIDKVCGPQHTNDDRIRVALDELRRDIHAHVVEFNDSFERRHCDVLSSFRVTIARLEAEQSL